MPLLLIDLCLVFCFCTQVVTVQMSLIANNGIFHKFVTPGNDISGNLSMRQHNYLNMSPRLLKKAQPCIEKRKST